MNKAGMVRRIDELGRVVIPKEIRRNMRLKEGEELEVFLGEEDTVVLKKYSPLNAYLKVAKKYRTVLEELTGNSIVVTDKDSIIASKNKDEIGGNISKRLENIINARHAEYTQLKISDASKDEQCLVCPIIARGDTLGALVMLGEKTASKDNEAILKAAVELIAISIE